jgi:endoglucanase
MAGLATTVSAHGHVANIIHNGVSYEGFNPQVHPYHGFPAVVGWAATNEDNGFISPDAYGSEDIICHHEASPGQLHITVAAGDSITIQWTPWPETHHGPVINHLAACNGPCESVDKNTLEFFRIDGVGIVEQGYSGTPGRWGSDLLIQAGNTWTVTIPITLKPGNYVLRHDIIALHSAGEYGGAQSYPQCINIEVTGGGSDLPAGTRGVQLFSPNDPSIIVNIYQDGIDYVIPGGPVAIGGSVNGIAHVQPAWARDAAPKRAAAFEA